MNTSEKLDQLIPALAAARLDFGEIKKSKTNPHFKSTYAALDDIFPAVDKALAAHGLVLMGGIETPQLGTVRVTTRLTHTSEQYIQCVIEAAYEAHKLQDLGGTIPYLRRYSVNTLLELAADEDLDERSSLRPKDGIRQRRDERPAQPAKPSGDEHPTREQINELAELARACAVDLVTFGQHMRRLLDLPVE